MAGAGCAIAHGRLALARSSCQDLAHSSELVAGVNVNHCSQCLQQGKILCMFTHAACHQAPSNLLYKQDEHS